MTFSTAICASRQSGCGVLTLERSTALAFSSSSCVVILRSFDFISFTALSVLRWPSVACWMSWCSERILITQLCISAFLPARSPSFSQHGMPGNVPTLRSTCAVFCWILSLARPISIFLDQTLSSSSSAARCMSPSCLSHARIDWISVNCQSSYICILSVFSLNSFCRVASLAPFLASCWSSQSVSFLSLASVSRSPLVCFSNESSTDCRLRSKVVPSSAFSITSFGLVEEPCRTRSSTARSKTDLILENSGA